MSLVHTEIILKNAKDLVLAEDGYKAETEVRQITVKALVDTGAWTLVINEEIREKLGLSVTGTGYGALANGVENEYDMAGPIELKWKDRRVLLDALVIPEADSILLGAIPLEAMDLTINPRRELVVASKKETKHFI